LLIYGLYGSASKGGFFDIPLGWQQFTSSPHIYVPGFVMCFTVAAFNFFGLMVTKHISATARSTVDTCRTLFIWAASLALGWEEFKWLQVAGFSLLIYGTFVYNGVVKPLFGERTA